MDYRREIDGLRALAVVPVILFHAGFSTFSGGFVGVDVFFVISGYLITSIIVGEQEAGKFSLINFYERRARRILPALFVMMFACLPLAWFWLLPADMKSFAQSLVAVSGFSSNILFWLSSGYFETAAELKPLLHTWSLAVEEQYYLFFPILMMVFWRFGRRTVLLILFILGTASLAAAQWGSVHSPSATFYLLPARGWELLIGASVALGLTSQYQFSFGNTARNAGSMLGLAMIMVAVFAFDKQTPFPSLYALLPTVGAACILVFANEQTHVGKLLGSKVCVGLGLISYSAYLWHQPLFAFARHGSEDEPGRLLLAALALLALLLAFLSWKYVETPFRNRRRFGRGRIFALSLAGSAFFVALGLTGWKTGVPTYWAMQNPSLSNLPQSASKIAMRDCARELGRHGDVTCRVSGQGKIRIVLWGDSHAGVLGDNIPAIDNVEFYVIAHAGCPPVVGVRRFDGVDNAVNCSETKILSDYAAYINTLSPDAVVLVGRWTLYLNGWTKGGRLQHAHHFLSAVDGQVSPPSVQYRREMLEQQLRKTATLLSGHAKVYILTQPPDLAQFVFSKVLRFNYATPLNKTLAWHKEELALFDSLTGDPHFEILDTKRYFCDNGMCRTRKDGALLYFDDNHLSALGASMVWSMLEQKLVSGLTQR